MVMEQTITAGELMSFYAIIGYFTGPVSSLIGWELLTFRFESKIPSYLKLLFYIPKFYFSMLIGLIYLPFWLFKKIF